MPRAEPPSQGETEVAKQSESVAELAAGLESSGLDEITMQLNPQGQKRQQPEPADDPELSNHQPIHPLKRLRKSSPEEAPRSPPTAIPSSLEDSLSDRDQTEACLDGANQEADERPLDEDMDEYGDEAREEEEEHNTPEGEWRANDTICPQCDDGGARQGQSWDRMEHMNAAASYECAHHDIHINKNHRQCCLVCSTLGVHMVLFCMADYQLFMSILTTTAMAVALC